MSNGLGNAIAALGAGVAGYARGKAIYDDREFEKEERDRRRLEWKDQDLVRADQEALRADFMTGMGDATPQQPPMIPYARTGMSDSAQQAAPGQQSMPGQQVMPWQQATPGLAAAQKVDAVMTQPGGQPSGLSQAPKTPTMIAHGQRLLKGYESVMTGAAKRGDIDSFTQAFNKAAEVRGIIRSNLREQADREHVLSGGKDFSPYARIFSEMVDDGTTLEAITNQNGSYTLKGTGRDGKPFEHHVKDASEMRGLINQLFDPSAMRQLEAQRAQEVWKSNLDTAKGIAIATGTEAAKARYREPAKPEEAKVTQLDMGEGRPKQLVITRGGEVISTVGGEDAGEAAPLDKKTTDALRTTLMGLYQVSNMSSMDPQIRQTLGQALKLGSQLVQSNQGSEAGRRLDTNTAANIAARLADGLLQETQFTDSEGNKWRGVEFEGVKYLLDLEPIKPDNNESAAKAQKAASDAGIKFFGKAPPLKKTAYAGKEAPPKRGKDANVPAGAVWSKEIGAWVEQGVGKTRIYYPEQ